MTGKCPQCGTEFQKRSTNHIYCSFECVKKASYARVMARRTHEEVEKDLMRTCYQCMVDFEHFKAHYLEKLSQSQSRPSSMPARAP